MSAPESCILRIVVILGSHYPVVRAELADGEEGEFKSDVGEIRISPSIAPHRLWEVESHEIFHVAEHVMDIPRRLGEELGLNETTIGRIREVYAGTVLPVFLDALERNGFLRRPRYEGEDQ